MDKLKKMKKKLFIGGAYLVVALLLLIYVSYSAYRINYTATVQMPEALEQKASLTITQYSQAEGKAKDTTGTEFTEIVLKDLRPNEDVDKYAADKTLAAANGRIIEFSVSNANIVNATTNELGDYSRLKTYFTINLEETGTVPISCILVNEEDKTKTQYTLSTSDQYAERSGAFRKYTSETDYKNAVFELDNTKPQTLHFTMYVGWNNWGGVFDGSDRKEIATIHITPVITESVPIIATPQQIEPTLKSKQVHYSLSSKSETGE